MNTSQLLNQVLIQGGATINPITLDSYKGYGYGVAISKSYERVIELKGDSKELQGMFNTVIADLRVIADRSRAYVGCWIDSGKLYLDVTEVITSRDRAIRVGETRGQLGIYDFKSQLTIDLRVK